MGSSVCVEYGDARYELTMLYSMSMSCIDLCSGLHVEAEVTSRPLNRGRLARGWIRGWWVVIRRVHDGDLQKVSAHDSDVLIHTDVVSS